MPGMRLGLLGGSFDPAHAGHVAVSEVALRSLRLDQVWWLVSPHNPLKPNLPGDLARRLAAARALAVHRRIKVTAIETALGSGFTAHTLRRLLPRLPGVHAVWLMGADSLASFHQWHDWRSIAASLPLAVFNRPGWAQPALSAPAAFALRRRRIEPSDAAALPSIEPPAWVYIPFPSISLSSTAIRAAKSRRAS